jgi:type IX secretion system PorP/SprF family membrane protein
VGYFTPVKNQRSGMGLNIQRMTVGLEKRISLTGDYSYQVRLDWYNFLRLGLRVGILNYDNDLAAYQLYPDRIPDPQFIPDVRYYNMTTFGVGGVFYNDHLFISFSIPQIINNTFKVNRNNFYSSQASFRTAYLSGSYVYNVNNDIFIRPNLLMVATLGKPLYFDAAALVYLPNDLLLGISARTNGSVCFSAQYTFKNNIRIGFAADYALVSDIRKYQMGTYEFVLGYDLNVAKRKSSRPYYF